MGDRDLKLEDYQPTELNISCPRCSRSATATTHALKARYGNVTLGEVARLVAADGQPPCNLAGENNLCSVVPVEPPVEQWATLSHARVGGWIGWLTCERRLSGLKRSKACPNAFPIDVHTLSMTLEWSFPLARLPMRLQCPACETKSISIEWVVPGDPEPSPAAPAKRVPRLAKAKLKLVPGGRGNRRAA